MTGGNSWDGGSATSAGNIRGLSVTGKYGTRLESGGIGSASYPKPDAATSNRAEVTGAKMTATGAIVRTHANATTKAGDE